MHNVQLFAVHVADNHFANIIHFLTTWMAPEGYTSKEKKELVVHVTNLLVIAGNLYKMGTYEILQ